MPGRFAVILRGASGVGKSAILDALKERLGSRVAIRVLDSGWSPGETRFMGTTRYRDLVCPEEILAIELGIAEPPGFQFLGATRNPREWIAILERARRRIQFFYVSAPVEVALRRNLTRTSPVDLRAVMAAHALHADGELYSRAEFESNTGTEYRESLIDSTRLSAEAASDAIIAAIESTRI